MFYDIYKNLCQSIGKSPTAVSVELGISRGTVSNWKNKGAVPSGEILQKIAEYFDVTTDFLLYGTTDRLVDKIAAAKIKRYEQIKKSPDNMSEDDNINKIINALKNNPDVLFVSPTRKVPIVGSIACGTPILAEQNIDGYLDVEVKSNVDFALTCKGDSMAPKLLNEDIVLIHRQPVVDNGETAAVLIGEEATLKRVYIRDNSIILAPENLNYEPIHLTGEDMSNVSILGKVVGYVRYF